MVTNPLTTTRNTFGVFRKYLFHPSYDSDLVVDPRDLSNLGPRMPPIEPNSTECQGHSHPKLSAPLRGSNRPLLASTELAW